MTNRIDPHHTGPASDPAAEPTPTELLAWLRGREAVVDRRLEAHREGLVRALDAKLEPVTKQLSELQLQADSTTRQVEDATRHLRSHVVADQPHSLTSYPSNDGILDHLKKIEASFEVVEDVVRSLSRDFTHHLDLHEKLGGDEEPDGMTVGPSGDGQSDLKMITYSQQLRTAYRTFMRYVADPTVTREQFDVAVHEFRENVFDLTRHMRIELANREGQGAQAT
jgi:hypothetical protein